MSPQVIEFFCLLVLMTKNQTLDFTRNSEMHLLCSCRTVEVTRTRSGRPKVKPLVSF